MAFVCHIVACTSNLGQSKTILVHLKDAALPRRLYSDLDVATRQSVRRYLGNRYHSSQQLFLNNLSIYIGLNECGVLNPTPLWIQNTVILYGVSPAVEKVLKTMDGVQSMEEDQRVHLDRSITNLETRDNVEGSSAQQNIQILHADKVRDAEISPPLPRL